MSNFEKVDRKWKGYQLREIYSLEVFEKNLQLVRVSLLTQCLIETLDWRELYRFT